MLDEGITIVQSQKKIIKFDKPIACGFTVLENAKHIMGDFWYNVLKPKYGKKLSLSLVTQIALFSEYTAMIHMKICIKCVIYWICLDIIKILLLGNYTIKKIEKFQENLVMKNHKK